VIAPYLWVKTPAGLTSWQMFDHMLRELNLVMTPRNGISATCAFAQHKIESGEPPNEILSVATYFCRSAQMRIDTQFAGISQNADRAGYDLTQELMAGKHADLRKGIVGS
jgi:hypothetical protein